MPQPPDSHGAPQARRSDPPVVQLRRRAEAQAERRSKPPRQTTWYDAEVLLGEWERDDGASDDPAAMHELLQLTWAQRQAQSHTSQARGMRVATHFRLRADARRAHVARSW